MGDEQLPIKEEKLLENSKARQKYFNPNICVENVVKHLNNHVTYRAVKYKSDNNGLKFRYFMVEYRMIRGYFFAKLELS
jgi:hypothetical protein